MKTKTIIKIEEKFLYVIKAEEPKEKKEDLQLIGCTSFEFGDELKKDAKSSPGVMAAFINDCLKNAEVELKEIELLFDSKLGFFKEYRFKNLDKNMAEKCFYVEDDNQKETKDSINISYKLNYPGPDSDGEMSHASIFGIDDNYFRTLIKSLNKYDIKVRFATSSIIVFKDTIKNHAADLAVTEGDFKKIIALDIIDNTYRAVVLSEGKIIHIEESFVPEDAKPEDRNLNDMLTDLLKEYGTVKKETIVIVSGPDSVANAKRLKGYSDINCKPIKKFYDEAIYEEAFCTLGINAKKRRKTDFLYGGMVKHRFARSTTIICIVAAALLALLFSMLPAYYIYMIDLNKDLHKEIEQEKYKTKLGLIYENRDVFTKLEVYKNDFAGIDDEGLNYAGVLTTLRNELLADTIINDLFYDEKSGLIVDFDVENPEKYEKARNKLNDKREILIVETSTRVAADGSGKKNIQIKVTIPKEESK